MASNKRDSSLWLDRRQLLHAGLSTLGVALLARCSPPSEPVDGGATGDAGTDGAPADSGASGTDASADGGASIEGPGPSFVVRSAVGGERVAFCAGVAFRRGQFARGTSAATNVTRAQVTVKNRWDDGSIKFAIVAGELALAAGAAQSVEVIAGPSATGAALTTAELVASNATVSVDCGAYGSVRWQADDWRTPEREWIAGPQMSSWIYRKAVGSDPHLVVWLEVRLYASGDVEVLPWIENGFLLVAAPTNKSARYVVSFNGSERFAASVDLKHHTRTPLIDGAALSYWSRVDPQVSIKHDRAYLQRTELVPTYRATVAESAQIVTELVSRYTPLAAGNIAYQGDSMRASGYQSPIGLLPEYDVLYLTCDAPSTYAAVVRNGYSAGRYAIHYRDERTQRPIRFSQYPTLALADNQGFVDCGDSTTRTKPPVATGGNPPSWDTAHCPSVGFLAYLVTGRWYFVEETQFAATAMYLGKGDNNVLRVGSKGLVQSTLGAWQTRACAWQWRSLVQALCVTPDDDTDLRNELIASVQSNVEHYFDRYVAQRNNPFGWVQPGETYGSTGLQFGASWQQDFVTAAFGYSIAMGLPISAMHAEKLRAFFAWKARSVIGRLGTREGFWYVNAAPYTMSISPAQLPDFERGTGPWLDDEAAVYEATYRTPPMPDWRSTMEGVLAAEIFPGDRSMWGNLQPAIAYAVRFEVPGAREAYDRMVNASNWARIRDAFNIAPVWSVAPATQR